MTTYCLTLDVATERDLSEIGQKAFSLARMRALGIPVPPGFVVTRQAFDVFLDVNRLRPEISRWEKSQDPEESATRIKQLVLSASLPIPVWDEVRRLRDEILGQDSTHRLGQVGHIVKPVRRSLEKPAANLSGPIAGQIVPGQPDG